jgi:Na+/H+ antiporter NhaC
MEPNILSLLPPFIVLFLGYATRNIWLSLFAGIFSAAFIATGFSPVETLTLAFSKLFLNLDIDKFFFPSRFWQSWNSFICIFLFILGILVTLMRYSGGAFAYGNAIKSRIKDKKSAETSSLVLSMILFVDDYFSSLTVGSVMRPITDKMKIPRAKLAFLVDSMSAPLAILCPFSSWVAAIIGFLKENGISSVPTENTLIIASPLSTYLSMIPYIFYSFIIMGTTFFIVRRGVSFGLMGKHEEIARATGNLVGGQKIQDDTSYDPHERNKRNASLIDFLFPILTLMVCVISGLLFSGEAAIFCGSRSCIEALQNSSAAIALFTGGIFTLLICTLFFLFRRKIALKELPSLYWEGILLMLPAVIVLILAWTLGDILRNDLMTGDYIAITMVGSFSVPLLPVLFFGASCLISLSIGSSWGTAAIMFPIAIPMVVAVSNAETPTTMAALPLFYPILGAVLSGCVAGDHISPISDTTVMSATSTGSPHMDHVRTQMTYAIPVIIVTALAFLMVGYLLTVVSAMIALLITIPTAMALSFSIFSLTKGVHLP